MDVLDKIDWTAFASNAFKVAVTGVVAAFAAFYGMDKRISLMEASEKNQQEINAGHSEGMKELNQRMLNLNERMQKKINQDTEAQAELLDKLDGRFVRRPLYEAHEDNVNRRLQWLNSDVQKLIDLQMGTGIFRREPLLPNPQPGTLNNERQ